MHHTVFAVYEICPVSIVEAGEVFCANDEAFAEYAKSRGFTDRREYSGHIEWWAADGNSFIVDCGKVNNQSHATFAAECIGRAGKSLA